MYEQLAPVFNPESVAVIGARRASGPGSFNVVENLDKFGFDGTIYPVNPKADEVLGREAFDDIRAIDDQVEHAIIFLPRHIVVDALQACGECDIPAVTIVSQGFSDADEQGAQMQEDLVDISEDYGIHLVGPNTMGVHDFTTNFTTAFAPIAHRETKPIGVISQTGLFSMSFPGLLYAKFIDLGNAAGLDHIDVLQYYAEDPEIEQVFMHIEGLNEGRGRELIKTAQEAITDGTAVMALKTGTSESGRRQAESHTGSLLGSDAVFRGAFKQAGIQRVQDYTEARVKSQALLELPQMNDKRIGMITHHGAAMIMAMDAAEEFDLEMADVSEETIKAVATMSPDWLDVENPLDIGPATVVDAPAAHEASIKASLKDDAVDALLLSVHIADPSPWPTGVWGHLDALEKHAPEYSKPVVVVPAGTDQEETRERLAEVENVLVLDDIRQAMNAFRTVYDVSTDAKRGED